MRFRSQKRGECFETQLISYSRHLFVCMVYSVLWLFLTSEVHKDSTLFFSVVNFDFSIVEAIPFSSWFVGIKVKFLNCACKTMSAVTVTFITAAACKRWMQRGSYGNVGGLHINFVLVFSTLNIQF